MGGGERETGTDIDRDKERQTHRRIDLPVREVKDRLMFHLASLIFIARGPEICSPLQPVNIARARISGGGGRGAGGIKNNGLILFYFTCLDSLHGTHSGGVSFDHFCCVILKKTLTLKINNSAVQSSSPSLIDGKYEVCTLRAMRHDCEMDSTAMYAVFPVILVLRTLNVVTRGGVKWILRQAAFQNTSINSPRNANLHRHHPTIQAQ